MKPTAIFLSLLPLLSVSISQGADPIAVEVMIQSVNAASRQITVLYNTKSGQKAISLDVSRKAEITLNGKAVSLQSLGAGLKAKVEYHKELAIVTKIEATGTIKKIAPVIRLKIQISEFGDVTLSAWKTNQAAPDDFEGTALAVPHLPCTKAWVESNGQARLVHTFGDGAEVKALSRYSNNVSIDQETKSLVFKTKDKTKKSKSVLSYFQRVRFPVTIIVDFAQHDGSAFRVNLMQRQLKQLQCYIVPDGKTPNKRFVLQAVWAESNAENKRVFSNLLTVEPTALDEPLERIFRLPVPNAKIDETFVVDLGKGSGDRPTTITRLEVRGQLAPLFGITLAKQDKFVFMKQVLPGSLAERGGLKRGDVVREINGRHPQTAEEASDMLGRVNFGQEVHLVIERAGTKKELRFTAM